MSYKFTKNDTRITPTYFQKQKTKQKHFVTKHILCNAVCNATFIIYWCHQTLFFLLKRQNFTKWLWGPKIADKL